MGSLNYIFKFWTNIFTKSVNYKIFVAREKKELERIIKKLKCDEGPILIKIKISKTKNIGKRISIEPEKIKSRFQESLI